MSGIETMVQYLTPIVSWSVAVISMVLMEITVGNQS